MDIGHSTPESPNGILKLGEILEIREIQIPTTAVGLGNARKIELPDGDGGGRRIMDLHPTLSQDRTPQANAAHVIAGERRVALGSDVGHQPRLLSRVSSTSKKTTFVEKVRMDLQAQLNFFKELRD